VTVYAEVIGDPIAQSKSPAIHNYWLGKLGLEAEYKACHVRSDELDAYLVSRRADKSWRGCNVTMPHKEAILRGSRLDGVIARAAMVGAANTVVKKRGKLTGDNTDLAGFIEPLEAFLKERHLFRMARVLGTGGAARAIVFELDRHDFTIVLAGRDPSKARKLLDDLAPPGRNGPEHHAVDIAHFVDATDFAFDDREGCFDLIINASPLGMAGQPPLKFDFSHAPPGSVVYDIVTHPLETEFLKAARGAGFRTIDGLSMLIGQAAIAFEKFFGIAPPRENGDAELRRLLTS
jgi:shikimate dehydrogenase